MRHENYWKVNEGHTIGLDKMNREEADMLWRAAIKGRVVVQPSLQLYPMEENLYYHLNPEHPAFRKPCPEPQEPERIITHGVQAQFHPFNSARGVTFDVK